MARPKTEAQQKKFLATLREQGGHAGNTRLMRLLKMSESEYWRVRNVLLDEGLVVRGRGKGGSVDLVEVEPEASTGNSADVPPAESRKAKEADLYKPCEDTLRKKWAPERGLDQVHVETTAFQGRRVTGGEWTRPDITAISMRTFTHWPGRVYDVWTFEVKPTWAFSVDGVFEAAAHARSATQSYVLYHVKKVEDPDSEHLARLLSEANRLGVGMVLFTDPADFESWDFRAHPVRREPDPALLEEFVATQLSAAGRSQLLKWK